MTVPRYEFPETVRLVVEAEARVVLPVSVGEALKTSEPVPVSSVTAEIKLALDGVASQVAIPEPRPEIPVDTGRPVALVRVAAEGVPKFGVVNVGELEKTKEPEPVSSLMIEARPAEVVVAVKAEVPLPIRRPVSEVAPVPPYGTPTVDPFQIPESIVPRLVIPETVRRVIVLVAKVVVALKVLVPVQVLLVEKSKLMSPVLELYEIGEELVSRPLKYEGVRAVVEA